MQKQELDQAEQAHQTVPTTPQSELPEGTEKEVTPSRNTSGFKSWWHPWGEALREVFPIFLAFRIVGVMMSFLAIAIKAKDFTANNVPIYMLWEAWRHKDTHHYIFIANNGYKPEYRTAFFPLFPLLERWGGKIVGDPYIAGLIISNVAALVMLVVFYRLIQEDFSKEHASRAVLYFSIFPGAFFFMAAYNESLFMCFIFLSFYAMRHGRWWWAGAFGCLASLSRLAGAFLFLAFCYEYLRQHDFKLRQLRIDVLGGLIIPSGTALFSLYCFIRFGDPLAFSHAQDHWDRIYTFPLQAWWISIDSIIKSGSVLNWMAIRNIIDLSASVIITVALLLALVGPWRLPRKYWLYLAYALPLWFLFQLSAIAPPYPLKSAERYILELFPAFIVLASIGIRYKSFNIYYLLISGTLFFYLLSQFVTWRWVV